MIKDTVQIRADNLTIAYGDFVLMKNLSFNVNEHDIFIIMGGSGCGKSSLLRILTGLHASPTGNFDRRD